MKSTTGRIWSTTSKPISLISLFILFLVVGCNTPKKHFQRGQYETAIIKSVQKIRKNPKAANKHGEILSRSFQIFSIRVNDRIDQLKAENRPQNHLSIYRLLVQLDHIQKEVATVMPLRVHGREIPLELRNLQADMLFYKNSAAGHLYNEAVVLLDREDKQSARLAYHKLREIRTLFPDYEDVRDLLPTALDRGQNRVLVNAINQTIYMLPVAFLENLTRYNPDRLNSQWTRFHTMGTQDQYFDYYVDIIIQIAEIGPEQIYEVRSQEFRELQDGFRYQLDRRGQVAKDSLGNDIKIPNIIRVSADVLGVEQTKAGMVRGMVNFVRADGRLVESFPFQEELLFKNFFYTFQGDERALSRETRELIGGGFVPFPTNLQMIMDASEVIRTRTHNLIRRNAKLLEN
jgi:hypothetical protein